MVSNVALEQVRLCPICGCEGRLALAAVKDRFFGVPGSWRVAECTNTACQTLWLDPRPAERDISFAYANYYTHVPIDVVPRRSFMGRAKEAIKDWIRRTYISTHWTRMAYTGGPWRVISGACAGLLAGGAEGIDADVFFLGASGGSRRLLDVGCGGGAALRRMKALGWEVEGLETDAAAAAEAGKSGCIVHRAPLTDANLPGERYDAIVMAHVIEHLHDPVPHLRECSRLLKSGGVLVLLTPNGNSWGRRHFGQDWRGLEVPRHMTIFNRASLGQLAERCGLQVQSSRCLTRGSYVTLTASHYARRHRTRGLPGVSTFGRGARWVGWGFQILSKVLFVFDSESPEEVLLIARKPEAAG